MAKDRSSKIRFRGTGCGVPPVPFVDVDGDPYTIEITHRKKRKRRDIYIALEQKAMDEMTVAHLSVDQTRAIIAQLEQVITEIEPPIVDTNPHLDELDNIDQTLIDIPVDDGTT